MKACVLIPCYNEVSSIGDVVKGALLYLEEIVVVDDGSTDGTSVAARDSGATVLRHEKNKGKGEALRTGFSYALEKGYDAVIVMDGDGQHDCHEITNFIKTAEEENADIVVGNRMEGAGIKKMPLIRWLTNLFTSKIISNIAGQKIPDSQCGFRLIKVNVLKNVELLTSRFDTESEILIKSARSGHKITSVPIKTIYRDEKSKINPVKDTVRFFRLIYDAISGNKK